MDNFSNRFQGGQAVAVALVAGLCIRRCFSGASAAGERGLEEIVPGRSSAVPVKGYIDVWIVAHAIDLLR